MQNCTGSLHLFSPCPSGLNVASHELAISTRRFFGFTDFLAGTSVSIPFPSKPFRSRFRMAGVSILRIRAWASAYTKTPKCFSIGHPDNIFFTITGKTMPPLFAGLINNEHLKHFRVRQTAKLIENRFVAIGYGRQWYPSCPSWLAGTSARTIRTFRPETSI